MDKVSINKSMKLSQHFTLGEFCKTSYHTLDGNIPSHVAIENLKRLCIWLEDLRFSYNELYGEGDRSQESGKATGRRAQFGNDSRNDGEIPIIISSGYRSEEVNRKCGGAKGSNHLTGCAVDIHCYGPEQMIRMAGILLDIADGTKREFDELIQEKRGSTYWVHFAVRPSGNRRKILFDCR
ncbi:MAG: hypothetical protein IKY01_12580 [Prevotella sp.]|nr:hypothetical protein [Prevotella sp.]